MNAPIKFNQSKYPFQKMEVGDSVTFANYSRKSMSHYSNAFRNWARYREIKEGVKRICEVKKEGNNIILARIK